jgi:hypothetical protein
MQSKPFSTRKRHFDGTWWSDFDDQFSEAVIFDASEGFSTSIDPTGNGAMVTTFIASFQSRKRFLAITGVGQAVCH